MQQVTEAGIHYDSLVTCLYLCVLFFTNDYKQKNKYH